MKFKIGDKVIIIKACNCIYANNCNLLRGLKKVGVIISEGDELRNWRVRTSPEDVCLFKEEQLVLAEAFIPPDKRFGIAKFCDKYYK